MRMAGGNLFFDGYSLLSFWKVGVVAFFSWIFKNIWVMFEGTLMDLEMMMMLIFWFPTILDEGIWEWL